MNRNSASFPICFTVSPVALEKSSLEELVEGNFVHFVGVKRTNGSSGVVTCNISPLDVEGQQKGSSRVFDELVGCFFGGESLFTPETTEIK